MQRKNFSEVTVVDGAMLLLDGGDMFQGTLESKVLDVSVFGPSGASVVAPSPRWKSLVPTIEMVIGADDGSGAG